MAGVLRFFPMLALAWALGAALAARAEPVAPRHPFLSPTDANNIHSDAYGSNTHLVRGPEGRSQIDYFRFGWFAGECAAPAIDRRGRILSVCVRALRSRLVMLDPNGLSQIASFGLPRRKGTILGLLAGRAEKVFQDTSGGSYFYLDQKDRAVIATTERHIWVVGAHEDAHGRIHFEKEEDYDLTGVVPGNCPLLPGEDRPDCDKVTTALPDWNGRIWFITQKGRIGAVNPATHAVALIQLDHEGIENSFSVDESSVYVVSDHALYRLRADALGRPEVLWREPYDRGTRIKVGQISQGSGTTPTILKSGYVVIADNADPQLHLLVYRREARPGQSRLVCQVPLFGPGASATENSVIGFERSVIVENNSGYRNAFERDRPEGGIARVDIAPDESGCRVVWVSPEVSPSVVPKLSLANRLVYIYTVKHKYWALTGVDFDTGETSVSIPTGRRCSDNNNWGAITLGPRDGEALIGSLKGMIQVRER